MLLVIALGACGQLQRAPAPELTGSYSGVTANGRPVSLTLTQNENSTVGRGTIDGRPFGLSALTAPQGPAVLSFDDGQIASGGIALAPNGGSFTLTGLGPALPLARGSAPLPAAGGDFAGRYVAEGPLPIWLELSQGGNLLAGTGFPDRRPVALVGRVTAPDRAHGRVLFADASENGVTVMLSADRRLLSVAGLGGVIEMRRQ